MLKIKNLSKRYDNGVQALNNINLSIDKGMFGLLGPNGAGKSSFMRTLATLIKRLMENSPKPVATSQLTEALWPDELPQSNPLRANVYALRKQLKNTFQIELVHNVKGIGYKFDVEI